MADEEQLLNFIKKIAKEQKLEDFDVKITPVSSGGANYTSTLYRVKVSAEGRDDLHLFAKVAVWSEKMRNMTEFNFYDNERVVYSTIMKTYRNLEEKHGVAEENRLRLAKYYGADSTHMHETIVLEDLTSRGFKSANRFESVDWPYAAAAITELAKFHALSIAYQHENPSEFEKLRTIFPGKIMIRSEENDKFFGRSIKSALETLREDNKGKLKTFIEKQEDLFAYFFGMLPALRREVLMHVDFRPNNMLHKVIDETTTEVIPVDYQTIQLGSPVIDLLYFIFTATDGQFRTKYYQKLVNHYYSELGAALARLGLDVKNEYPRPDFEFDLKEKLPFGLLIMVMFLPIFTMPEDQAPKLDNSLDLYSLVLENDTDLYSQKINDVVDDYARWGVL